MNEFKQVIQIEMTPEQLENMFSKVVQEKINQLKKEEETKNLPDYLTQKEVAEFYNVHRGTVSNWEKNKYLTRVVIGGIPKYKKAEVLALENKK